MAETTRPIERGTTYRDTVTDLYVRVSKFWIDEEGNTQVQVEQYTGIPTAAHNSCAHSDEYDARRLLTVDDIRSRILNGELKRASV